MDHRRRLTAIAAGALVALLPTVARANPSQPAVERGEGAVLTGLYPDTFDENQLAAVGAWGGKPIAIGGLFHATDENSSFSTVENRRHRTIWLLNSVWADQATPFSNVHMDHTAAQIAAGEADAEIVAWSREVGAWLNGENLAGQTAPTEGRSLIIAPLQEMNGDWTPYGCHRAHEGAGPVAESADYRTAYRRFVELFRFTTGADETRVRWAWAPNGYTTPGCGTLADYYPGDDVVDVIGVSAFNFGAAVPGARWETPAEAVGIYLDELRATVSADKPYVLAQTASAGSGGDKDAWIVDLFRLAATDPNVVALIWFNYDKYELGGHIDWKCCPERNPGWVEAVAGAEVRYRWPLTNWFRPGPLGLGGTETTLTDGVTLVTEAAPLSLLERLAVEAEAVCGAPWDEDEDASPPEPDPAPLPPPEPQPAAPHAVGVVDPATGRWLVRTREGEAATFYFGGPGDAPLLGDWNCDGVDTPGAYRTSEARLYLRTQPGEGPADIQYYLGSAGDIALAGDFDGDGCDSVSIYRPGTGEVFIVNDLRGPQDGDPGPAAVTYFFGDPGDTPFVGDFDGDGADTIGLYRESTGYVYFRQSHSQGLADAEFFFGDPGDRLVAGDWVSQGADTVAVFRPRDGSFHLRHTNTQGAADETISFDRGAWVPVSGVLALGNSSASAFG